MSVPPPPRDAAGPVQTPPAATEAAPITPPPARRGRLRWAWWLLAYASLGLGIVGIVVPGLPTVPADQLGQPQPRLLAQRLHARLLAHRRFGPMIRDWQAHGAVSRRAKRLAVSMMAACAAIMFLTAPKWWMAASGTAIMTVVAIWLWRRPEPPAG